MRVTAALALALTTSAVSAYSPDHKTIAEALRERERIFPGWNQTTTEKKTVSSLMYIPGGSCDRKCGGWSNGCWCDALCHYYKDCCFDKCAHCLSHAMWGSNNFCLLPPEGVCKDHCAAPVKPKPPADVPTDDVPSGD